MENQGWTPKQIGQLTFPQLRALSGQSKPHDIGYAESCRRIAEYRKRKAKK
jgi:hypothetical protein